MDESFVGCRVFGGEVGVCCLEDCRQLCGLLGGECIFLYEGIYFFPENFGHGFVEGRDHSLGIVVKNKKSGVFILKNERIGCENAECVVAFFV